MEHETYVPLIAYLVSCVGCGLGLVCTMRARVGGRAARNRWLALSAVSIGGTGIWAMHFIGMLGVTVPGSQVKWDIALTVLSLAIAIVVVGAGMLLVANGEPRIARMLPAGVITGCGVAIMHYTGMAAMRVQGSIHYDLPLVGLSIVIAIVAATAALWITRHVRRALAVIAAIPVMGLAVTGMHYTGMAATSVVLDADAPIPAGQDASLFIAPLMIWIIATMLATVFVVALAPSEEEILEDEHYQRLSAELLRSE